MIHADAPLLVWYLYFGWTFKTIATIWSCFFFFFSPLAYFVHCCVAVNQVLYWESNSCCMKEKKKMFDLNSKASGFHAVFESVCRTFHTMQPVRNARPISVREGLETSERASYFIDFHHHTKPTNLFQLHKQGQKVNKPLWIDLHTYRQRTKPFSNKKMTKTHTMRHRVSVVWRLLKLHATDQPEQYFCSPSCIAKYSAPVYNENIRLFW